MAFFQGKFNSNKQEWETPQSLFNQLNQRFNFTFDLAASATNTKCNNFYSEEDNSLSKIWTNEIYWLNPPYGGTKENKLENWIKKAYEAQNCTVVCLIPARTNTNWWHKYCMDSAEIIFINGRPKFNNATHGLPQPLSIVVFNDKHDTKYSTLKC